MRFTRCFANLPASATDAHPAELTRLEMDVEERLLYANPPVLAAARDGGRGPASASSSPRTCICRASSSWQRCARPVTATTARRWTLFLSAERGASKHDGDLYGQMLAELGCAPSEIVHVGDNFHSDVERAREARFARGSLADGGSRGRTAAHRSAEAGVTAAPFAEGDLLSSLCVGAVRRRRVLRPVRIATGPQTQANGQHAPSASTDASPAVPRASADSSRPAAEPEDSWDRLGYEVGGPLYFLFLHWILKQAREEGIERLYFLARDGYYLRQACEVLTAQAGFPWSRSTWRRRAGC